MVTIRTKDITKSELAKQLLTEAEQRNIDYAIPIEWIRSVQALGIDPSFYVWSYNNKGCFGEPLNLAERLLNSDKITFIHIS